MTPGFSDVPPPEPAPSPIKREIRPLVFNTQVVATPDGGCILVLTHPLDGDAYIYQLTPEQRKQLRDALSALQVATPDQVPQPPPS